MDRQFSFCVKSVLFCHRIDENNGIDFVIIMNSCFPLSILNVQYGNQMGCVSKFSTSSSFRVCSRYRKKISYCHGMVLDICSKKRNIHRIGERIDWFADYFHVILDMFSILSICSFFFDLPSVSGNLTIIWYRHLSSEWKNRHRSMRIQSNPWSPTNAGTLGLNWSWGECSEKLAILDIGCNGRFREDLISPTPGRGSQ